MVSVSALVEAICLRKRQHTYKFVFFGQQKNKKPGDFEAVAVFVFGLLRFIVQIRVNQGCWRKGTHFELINQTGLLLHKP